MSFLVKCGMCRVKVNRGSGTENGDRLGSTAYVMLAIVEESTSGPGYILIQS